MPNPRDNKPVRDTKKHNLRLGVMKTFVVRLRLGNRISPPMRLTCIRSEVHNLALERIQWKHQPNVQVPMIHSCIEEHITPVWETPSQFAKQLASITNPVMRTEP